MRLLMRSSGLCGARRIAVRASRCRPWEQGTAHRLRDSETCISAPRFQINEEIKRKTAKTSLRRSMFREKTGPGPRPIIIRARTAANYRNVLRLAKIAGAEETEVHVDEVADALTRFANNAIHQNVAEHGLTVSVRTVAEGRTARATTNRIDEDSLRSAVQARCPCAASQPRDPSLLPMPGSAEIPAGESVYRETAADYAR